MDFNKIRFVSKTLFYFLIFLFASACFHVPGELKPLVLKGSFLVGFEIAKCTNKKKKCDVPRLKPLQFKVKITALDHDGKVDTAFNDSVCVYSSKGILTRGLLGTKKAIPLKKGKVSSIKLFLRLPFGRTTIWASTNKPSVDWGKKCSRDKDCAEHKFKRCLSVSHPKTKKQVKHCGEECPDPADPNDQIRPSFGRSGAAKDMYFKNLSVRDVQEVTESPHNSPLMNKYSLITRGKLIVTAVTSNGFYITDIEEFAKPDSLFHSLFIFTFSAPSLGHEEGIEPRLLKIGDIVERVEGGVDEFSGHTQVIFPSFVPKWKDGIKDGEVVQVDPKKMPKPWNVELDKLWSRTSMEPYESALVEVRNAIAIPFNINDEAWGQFRQWPLLLVEAAKPEQQKACEELVKTELQLHADKSKNKNSPYRKCLDQCYASRQKMDKKCKKGDEICLGKGRDAWYKCFFQTCRFDRSKGLFSRIEKKGCRHGIILAISTSTVPSYDPASKAHLQRRFEHVRGVLIQVKASSYMKLYPGQYPDELSNNGYVIWVRGPKDLKLKK